MNSASVTPVTCAHTPRNGARKGLRSLTLAVGSVARNLPLLVRRRPRTILRVLCIMALDLVHTRRCGRPLPRERVKRLAALLDLGAVTNAAVDRKRYSRRERQNTLKLMRDRAIKAPLAEYLRRLRQLEANRPAPHGDVQRFEEVLLYRESVVRLSLAMLTCASGAGTDLDQQIQAIHHDGDVHCLFRLAMQCQVMDDLLDYPSDEAAGLPTLLTACHAPAESMALVQSASRRYAEHVAAESEADMSLRIALRVVSAMTALVFVMGRLRFGSSMRS